MGMIGGVLLNANRWAGYNPAHRRVGMKGFLPESEEPGQPAQSAHGQDDHDIHHTLVHSVSLSGFDRLIRRNNLRLAGTITEGWRDYSV